MDTLEFASPPEFRSWLELHHANCPGIWIKIFKKGSGIPSVTYAEALDEALCFGWIDGQKKPFDDQAWLQKFTPRTAKSGWSKVNTEHVERLEREGKMTSAGRLEVERAKADGRWDAAYSSFGSATPPEDFLELLEQHPKAKKFFATLNKTNTYSIVYRLETAKKPETRQRRMEQILTMLQQGKTFHPQSKGEKPS